ncbi:MAG: hypothetical protein QOI63_205 [Thermoplasmata archaeon]|nr:hypothetical protein [Thermoplasmata archaeon]
MDISRPTPALLVGALLLLLPPGCTQPVKGSLALPGDLPPPASLAVPRWLPGYHWEYRTEGGLWRNLTVQAEQAYSGQPAYKVRGDISPADQRGQTGFDLWFDRATLGLVAVRNEVAQAEFTPPWEQFFPMENRSVASMMRASGGYMEEHHGDIAVRGWEMVATPAGVLPAVRIAMSDQENNSTESRWYSPDVKNQVAFTADEGRYLLVSWGTKSA